MHSVACCDAPITEQPANATAAIGKATHNASDAFPQRTKIIRQLGREGKQFSLTQPRSFGTLVTALLELSCHAAGSRSPVKYSASRRFAPMLMR